jgi:pilus assembly protein Flp/PilA
MEDEIISFIIGGLMYVTVAQHRYPHRLRLSETGQGLVEYALILVLVSVVVISVLAVVGDQVGGAFCQVINLLSDDIVPQCAEDVVVIASSHYSVSQNRLTLQATSDGGYSDEVVLIASPGGTLSKQGNHYAITIEPLTGCPCTVTVRSSKGGRDSVTVP